MWALQGSLQRLYFWRVTCSHVEYRACSCSTQNFLRLLVHLSWNDIIRKNMYIYIYAIYIYMFFRISFKDPIYIYIYTFPDPLCFVGLPPTVASTSATILRDVSLSVSRNWLAREKSPAAAKPAKQVITQTSRSRAEETEEDERDERWRSPERFYEDLTGNTPSERDW